jgi:hypothetical protein
MTKGVLLESSNIKGGDQIELENEETQIPMKVLIWSIRGIGKLAKV